MLGDLNFQQAIDALKANGARFTQVYTEFLGTEYFVKNDPVLYARFNTIKREADRVKNTIIYINKAVGDAFDWFGGLFNLNGIDTLNRVQNLKGLGVVPLIPIAYVLSASAAVLAVIATMTYFLSDAYKYKRKADLIAQGVDPSDLNERDANSFGSQISDVVKFGLILAAAYFIVPKLIKKG